MRSISISRSFAESTPVSGAGVPSSALRPRPKAFLCAMNDLLCKTDVRLGSLGLDVVKQDGLSMTGCFAQSDIARNNGREHLIPEKGFQVGHNLIGQVGALIEHR